MKTKFGALITDGRGKIGGQVASKNRSGSYLRTKVTPVNPQSSSQLGVRNRFTGLSQGWRGLTEAQRTAWNNAVSDYARTDIFGDLKNPTGINLYQRLNNVLLSLGQATITSPPVPESVGQVVLGVLTAANAVPALSAAFAPAVPEDCQIKVYATAPMSPGKNFVKSELRLISVLASAAPSPANLLAAYTAKFGAIGAIGTKIFVQFVPANSNTGQVGSPSQSSVIISA